MHTGILVYGMFSWLSLHLVTMEDDGKRFSATGLQQEPFHEEECFVWTLSITIYQVRIDKTSKHTWGYIQI